MAPLHSIPAAWPDPRALGPCLDEPIARRLGDGSGQALRVTLARATRTDDLIVADGLAVGRVLGHGSVALYRPDPAAPLRHRLLEVDPRGRVTVVLNRGARGELHEAWVRLADGSAAGVLPGGARHPLWGASDRLVHATAWRRSDDAHARRGCLLERRGPDSARRRAGPASLRRGRRAAERPRSARVGPGPARAALPRPVSDGAALLEPHRVLSLWRSRPRLRSSRAIPDERRGDVRAGRARGGPGRLDPRAPRAAGPLRRSRRPASGRHRAGHLAGPHATTGPSARASADESTASCAASRPGTARGATSRPSRPSERCWRTTSRSTSGETRSTATSPFPIRPSRRPWPRRGARPSAPSCPSRRRRSSPARSRPYGPRSDVVWGPVPGDLVETRGATLRLSPKLLRVYRAVLAAAPPPVHVEPWPSSSSARCSG